MTQQYIILDGECRYRASLAADLPVVPCIVLKRRPTSEEMLEIRLSIDVNRTNLKPMERAKALSDFIKRTGRTLVEASKRCGMSQSLGSKLVALTRLAPELQKKVNEGWDIERAYVISQEPDHQKQLLLATQTDLSREQLRQKARSGGKTVEVKTTVARFMLPDGGVVTVQGRRMNLSGAIDAMLEIVKELKKGQAEHWDISTAMRVLRDKAKSTQQSA